MREARLLGRDHTHIGSIAAVAEGPAAVALSAGGAPKRYAHTDANEDAVAFAFGARGALLVAADAHGGSSAAETAVGFLLDRCAADWVGGDLDPADWTGSVRQALWDLHEDVRRAAYQPDRQGSRTTLVLALVRGERLFVAALGDSHAFAVDGEGARDLAAPPEPCPPQFWPGSESLTPEQLAEHLVTHEGPSTGLRCLVLATDGISERQVGLADPAGATAEVAEQARGCHPDLRALETSRSLLERAQEAHRENPSGDNVGIAVLWLEGESAA